MKKIFSIITILGVFAVSSVSAQYQTPRFGTAPNQDNTYRAMTLGLRIINDTAGTTTDTFTVRPSTFDNHIYLTVKDSVAIAANVTGSFLEDQLLVTINNTAGANHKVYFTGVGGAATNWQLSSSGASIALTASKRATIYFIFDGTAWVEQYRMVQ